MTSLEVVNSIRMKAIDNAAIPGSMVRPEESDRGYQKAGHIVAQGIARVACLCWKDVDLRLAGAKHIENFPLNVHFRRVPYHS